MKLDINSALSAIQSNLHHLSEWFIQLQATLAHKIWTLVIGGGAVYTTGSAYTSASGDSIIARLLSMFTDLTLLEGLSIIATLLLIVERCFIVWAWYKRKKRGDYDEGNP